MPYRVLADLTVVIHLAFILYAAFGGLAVLRCPRTAWIHIPAVIWAAVVELAGWICPLTPLEIWLRTTGGSSAYATGFVDHYLVPIVYPGYLTRSVQIGLGLSVLLLNVLVYGVVWRWRRGASPQ